MITFKNVKPIKQVSRMINRHSSYSKTFKVVCKELQVKNKHNASETLEKNRNKIKQNE
jgi:hypothetical protein